MKFAVVYVDHIGIASKSFQKHTEHLDNIFSRLKQFNVILNLSKSKFCRNKIKYLGYVISDLGIMPDEEKVRFIQKFPEPKNFKQLLNILGLCTYYRKL